MKKIQQVKPYIGKQEIRAVSSTIKRNWITEGPQCKEFSNKLNALFNIRYGVFAPNGTLALSMALIALGVGRDDEVIVPDITFFGSASAVMLIGAKPVLVDVDKNTFHIDISKCNPTKKTKAIMPVHLYGTAAEMDPIIDFANQHNICVVEDAAQAVGVKLNNQHLGTFGHAGTFSFFADKTITTGEGGYIVCKEKDTYLKLLKIRNQGRITSGSFVHNQFGVNLRITDMQAAIGCEQLKKLDNIILKKAKILNWYREMLCGVKQVKFLNINPNANYIPFRVVVFCESTKKLMHRLKIKNIETRTFFYPLHKQPVFKACGYKSDNFKNSIYGYENGLCLPVYPQLKKHQVKYICATIKEFYEN